jgi:hypothetical protein
MFHLGCILHVLLVYLLSYSRRILYYPILKDYAVIFTTQSFIFQEFWVNKQLSSNDPEVNHCPIYCNTCWSVHFSCIHDNNLVEAAHVCKYVNNSISVFR